jgi:hypothetical protein
LGALLALLLCFGQASPAGASGGIGADADFCGATDLVSQRTPESVFVSWRTPVPTGYQATIQWFLGEEALGGPVTIEDTELSTDHTFSLLAPTADAWAEGCIAPAGSTPWFEPLTFSFPPLATASGFPAEAAGGADLASPLVAGALEVEPNDTYDLATPIPPGQTVFGSHNYLLDPDWYVIGVPARTTVKISFTRPITTYSASLTLDSYKDAADGSSPPTLFWPLLSTTYGTGENNVSTDYTLYEDTRLYIFIQEQTDYYLGPYELTVDFFPVLDPDEPDSFDSPRLLVPGAPPTIWFTEDRVDHDCFAVEVPPPLPGGVEKIISLQFTADPWGSGVYFAAYRPGTTTPEWEFIVQGEAFEAGIPAPVGGLYRFDMSGRARSQPLIPLTVRASVVDQPDPYEPNETRPAAVLWPSDGDTLQAYIQWLKDRDWYKFPMVAGQTTTITATALPPYATLSLVYQYAGYYRSLSWVPGPYGQYPAGMPFKAPGDGWYYLGVIPSSNPWWQPKYRGSSATLPYTLRVTGLGSPSPSITSPAEDAFVSPLAVSLAWSHEPPDGSIQGAYELEIGADASFGQLVFDSGVVESSSHCCLADLPSCGVMFARVKVRSALGTWSPWSRARSFQVGLVRLNSPPAIHYVTDLRPEGNFPFAYEVTTDCLLTAAIEDRFGVTVCPLTAAGTPGVHQLLWPGVVAPRGDYPPPLPPFAFILAPRGRYTLVFSASTTGEMPVTQVLEYGFLVAW